MQRRKVPSQQIPCEKQNCCGASVDRNNYLSGTSHKVISLKKKGMKKVKKKDETRELIRQSFLKIKEENSNLLAKLEGKKKKIEELKLRIKLQEGEIKVYEQKEEDWKTWKEKQEMMTEVRKKGHTESCQKAEKLHKIIEDSQTVAKETLRSYRTLEEEYTAYKENTERKISRLKRENLQIASDRVQKQYNKQIEELKKDLGKFKEEQLTSASFKNQQLSSNEQRMRLEISNLREVVNSIRMENERLQEENYQLEEELQSYRTLACEKEKELKSNLNKINEKVTNWEKQYKIIRDECREWEQQYNKVSEKLQRKRQKYRRNNEEWAAIFKEFLQQIDDLKVELETVNQRNVKLIKSYEIK